MAINVPIRPIAQGKSGVGARIFLFLFGLPFVAGGVFSFLAGWKAFNKPGAEVKEIAIPIIAGLAFGGVGCLFSLGSLLGGKKIAEDQQRRDANADKPWMWRDDWAQGHANGSNRKAQKGIWFFAIFWNLISAPLLFFLPGEIHDKPIAVLGLLFPVIGVGLIIWAVRASMRAQRFGATLFEMSPLPAVPGGRLSGTIRAHFPVQPTQGVSLKLSCLRRSFSGSGKDRSTREDIVWREELTLNANEVMVAGGEASIPVRFTLPADALETSTINDNEAGIIWTLVAAASLEGIDYQDDFELPVYRTGAPPLAEPEPLAAVGAASQPVFASDRADTLPVSLDEMARAGITVTPGPEGTEYRFAAGRNPGFAVGLIFFALIWSGAVVFLLFVKAPWFFTFIFGLFDALFLLIVLDMLLGARRLTVGNGVLQKLYTMAGLGRRTTIPFENISKIDLHINMQTSGRNGTPYYALRATFINGRTRDLAGGIKDKRQAEWLAAELRHAIGLKG